jgi:F-type H+-transporting ATPase subunit a
MVAAGGAYLTFGGLLIYVGLVLLAVFIFLGKAKKGLNERVFKNPFTQRFEQLYLFIENLCIGIIGPHGRKYIPMMIGFWLVIFFGNAAALFFATSPTADLSFNLGMALIMIGYVQHEGAKSNGGGPKGVLAHMKHFAGPKLSGLLMILVTPLIFMIEIISEVMKNLSLSLRLFGNIDGGHQAVEAMNALGADYYVPVGMFLLPIKLLTVIVQALIFCLLGCVYISLVTHHEEDHGTAAAH